MNRAQKAMAGADVLLDIGTINGADRALVHAWARGDWLDLAGHTRAALLAKLCIESYEDAHA
jgi:hypothetical protein